MVVDDTTDLLLEAAYFTPAFIRVTSRRTGVKTESSDRFARGVDPALRQWLRAGGEGVALDLGQTGPPGGGRVAQAEQALGVSAGSAALSPGSSVDWETNSAPVASNSRSISSTWRSTRSQRSGTRSRSATSPMSSLSW